MKEDNFIVRIEDCDTTPFLDWLFTMLGPEHGYHIQYLLVTCVQDRRTMNSLELKFEHVARALYLSRVPFEAIIRALSRPNGDPLQSTKK